MSVLGNQQQRRLSGDLCNQVQRCQSNPEDVWRSGVDKSKCGTQRMAMCLRHWVEPSENRAKKLMKAGKRQVCFRLGTSRSQHPNATNGSPSARLYEDSRLANSRLAANYRRAAALTDGREHAVHDCKLAIAADQTHV